MNTFGKDRGTELAMHPTVKPVTLVADAILDCSKRRFDEVYRLKAVHAESKLDFERLANERFKERHGRKAKNGKGHRAKDR